MEQASQIFWEKAQEVIGEMKNHQGEEKQLKEYRKVAGQLLFYAGITAIEEILSTKINTYVVGNHEKRGQALREHQHLFRNGERIERYYKILIEPGIDYRRKVAYRGENGHKFTLLEEFARLCIEELKND